jgi:hypothetical protein
VWPGNLPGETLASVEADIGAVLAALARATAFVTRPGRARRPAQLLGPRRMGQHRRDPDLRRGAPPAGRGLLHELAPDAVVQVRDAALPFEHPDPVQLALSEPEVLEQPAPLTQQYRDEVDLKLVQEPSG